MAIMREKHTALMKPIVFALEHVRSITAAPAETPHEKWFQDSYGDAIENALEKLKNPLNPAKPGSSWLPFKEVLYAQTEERVEPPDGLADPLLPILLPHQNHCVKHCLLCSHHGLFCLCNKSY